MRYVKTLTATPLNADGTISTLMATGYEHKSLYNAVSTSHFPAPIIIEVWECENGESVPQNNATDEFIKYMRCGRYRGRKIYNAARPIILLAVSELTERQFLRFRKLTPEESLSLMGVTESDAAKMMSVNSDKQIYKQAGNSIVVPVIYEIFKNMFHFKK